MGIEKTIVINIWKRDNLSLIIKIFYFDWGDTVENELDEVLEKIDNLIGSGRYMDCTVFLEKSLKKYPEGINFPEAEKIGDFNFAINSKVLSGYKNALETDPKNPVLLACLGHFYQRITDYNKAIVLIDKALEIDADYMFALENKAQILHQMGRYEDAVDVCYRMLKIDSKYVPALVETASISYDLKDYDMAFKLIDKALRIEPHNKDAIDARNEFMHD